MATNIPFGVASEIEIARQESRAPTNLSVSKFGAVAKVVWDKPSAAIAEIAGREIRTAERWLSGEFDPPPCVVAAMLAEIFPKRN